MIQRINIVEPPDPEWSLAVGEIVNNFRSALDYMVCAMTRENTGDVGKWTAYPLARSPEAFENRKHDYIGGLPTMFQNIISGFQPHDGDYPHAEGLSLLATLSNFDKHEALHLMGSIVTSGVTGIEKLPERQTVAWHNPSFHTGPFKDGDVVQEVDVREVTTVLSGPNSHVQIHSRFTFDVAFAEGGPCAGRPLIETLARVQDAVVDITGYFEMWFSPGLRTFWRAPRPASDT